MSKQATEKQIAFLNKLARERIYDGSLHFASLTSIEASRLIDKLLNSPVNQKPSAPMNGKVESALLQYALGRRIEAFEQLLGMTSEGVAQAEFALGKICKENNFSYLESDIWADLLSHKVQPRSEVAYLLYENYRGRGDSTSARKIAQEENLASAKEDLSTWDIFNDTEKVYKEANRIIREGHSIGYELQSNRTFELHYKYLKSICELAHLKSRFKYSGISEGTFKRHGMLTANLMDGDVLLNDMADVLANPLPAWEEVRSFCSDLIYQYHAKRPFVPEQLFLLAKIGQDAQERISFLRNSDEIDIRDEKAKQELTNIIFGLQQGNDLAGWYYRAKVQ
jgi:hypothetical protein